MTLTKTAQSLYDEFATWEIIDCHEHLHPESVRVAQTVDALTLFGHYCRTDLITAGMAPDDYPRIMSSDLPLELRWKIFRPHLDNIRHGSYARPAFIAAKEYFGFDDINDDNYVALSEAMQKANTPGAYQRYLRDQCKIRTCLTQCGRTDTESDLLTPLMPMGTYVDVLKWEVVEKRAAEMGERVNTLDDYIALINKGLAKWKSEGAVGIKMASNPYGPVERGLAHETFESLRTGARAEIAGPNPLRDFLLDRTLDLAADHDLVVAVHTGVWGDFRGLDVEHMIPILPRHPETRFDIYHLSIPSVRAAILVGKNNPNCWLNLCWCHIVSPKMTMSAMDEMLDLVPVNKVLGFGGDYGKPVEKAYGHLVMARENIATVLGRRVDDGLMTLEQAAAVARKWFWDNPVELYGLEV